jgi:hypothetical protein
VSGHIKDVVILSKAKNLKGWIIRDPSAMPQDDRKR